MSQNNFFKRRHFLNMSTALLVGGAFANASAQTMKKMLRVGIMAGQDEDLWAVASENAQKLDLTLKIVTFSDYSEPNEALAEHDLDANAFQHQPFLDAANKARGYQIQRIGDMDLQPISLFSKKYTSLSALPEGAKIGIPNDPSNEGRSLLLLQKHGLIKVSPDAALFPTILDITENPHNIDFKELDAGIIGRSLADLDAAIINGDWALKSGIDIERERILSEDVQNNPYVNFIAVNESDLKAPWVPLLVHSFQQPNIKQKIQEVYRGTAIAAWS